MNRRALIVGGLVSLAVPSRLIAKKRTKTKIITKSFRNFPPISLSEFGAMARPYPSVINVRGFEEGRIERVRVTIRGLSVPFSSLVSILLVAPNGRSVELLSRVGGPNPARLVVLTLDDRAKKPLPYNTRLRDGTFRPTRFYAYPYPDPAPPEPHGEKLAKFNGGNPNGNWKLFVMEDNAEAPGEIDAGWELHITARVKR